MPTADPLQRFIRTRAVRVILAVGLIAVGAWMFLPYINYRVASSAFVNSEIVRISAPIAGQLTTHLPRKGDLIESPTRMSLIKALSPDQRHLFQLESRRAVAKERAALVERQLQQIETTDAELATRLQTYREAMVARLTQERDEVKAEKTGCLAEASQRKDVASRLEKLVHSGVATPIRSAEMLALLQATATRCDMADARLKRLEIDLKSAAAGVYLRDGANDSPYSQQQRDRLLLRKQELEIKRLEEHMLAAKTAAEISEERERLERVNNFELSLSPKHVVWSVAASPGSMVSEGQTILDLAVCERRFVSVELPERDFEKIKSGSPTLVRLVGSHEWRAGQILQVRGSAARTDDRLLAAQVKRPDPNSITVEVGLPEDATTDRNSFCDIGRLAEVRFQRAGTGLFDGLGRSISNLFQSAGQPGQIARN